MKRNLTLILISFLLILPSSSAEAQESTSTNYVDILWQGNTYTPPFYKGRALWSNQSRITLVAIPHILGSNGVKVNPSSLIYRWKRDGTVIGTSSGVGKNSISFSDSIFSKPQLIKVDIFSTNNDELVIASASEYVRPADPLVLVYESNPLYGLMLHKEIGTSFSIEEKEVTFLAIPLFFNNLNLNYAWKINSETSQTGSSVTYRAPDQGEGSSNVLIQVSNKDKILQNAQKDFVVEFGDQSI